MKVKLRKLHPDAVIPTYATDGSGAFDLTATSREITSSGVIYGTGLAFEVPKGHVLYIYSRSGHGFRNALRLANAVGIIDSDYRGEVNIKLAYDGDGYADWPYIGDRIAQGIILKVPHIEFEEVEELSETQRGVNGFGSSGK